MTNSRQKGAAFEREIAKRLFQELGIIFRRDLDQYRQRDRGDLLANDGSWPFLLECKVTARPGYQSGWTSQVFRAVEDSPLHPCVVWKTPRQEPRYRVWFDALAEGLGGHAVSTQYADLSATGFAYIAREIMAGRAAK